MKTANDIFTWVFQSGAVIWLFYFALAIAKPWVDGKIKHAKTAQQRETWTLLEQVAMTTVNSLVSSNKSGSQKFLEASDQVQSYLADHGIHIDMKTVQSAVQAAYEKSPLMLTDPTPISGHEPVGSEGKVGTDGTAVAIDPKEAD
ncbi:phage holin, LLH family [Limosilactobacillus pontis]|uniref:phage holin, LLH family n=1 Tax=Limosilactobacillus pontis TaxID=35787 RepID=UPI002F25F6B0